MHIPTNIFKRASYLGAAFALLSLAVLMAFPAKTSASYYSPNLIDNGKFTASNSMGVTAIQSFLISKGSYLHSYHDTEDCGSTRGAHYSFYAARYHCGHSVLAAQIIYDAAHAYGISPRAIMATLQKEESLITDSSPSTSQLHFAMGYGCSDSSGCSQYSGFFHQVDNGTWQFRTDYELSSGRSYWGYSPLHILAMEQLSITRPRLRPAMTFTSKMIMAQPTPTSESQTPLQLPFTATHHTPTQVARVNTIPAVIGSYITTSIGGGRQGVAVITRPTLAARLQASDSCPSNTVVVLKA